MFKKYDESRLNDYVVEEISTNNNYAGTYKLSFLGLPFFCSKKKSFYAYKAFASCSNEDEENCR